MSILYEYQKSDSRIKVLIQTSMRVLRGIMECRKPGENIFCSLILMIFLTRTCLKSCIKEQKQTKELNWENEFKMLKLTAEELHC